MIKIKDYLITSDSNGYSVFYTYIGKSKEGKEKEMKRSVGYASSFDHCFNIIAEDILIRRVSREEVEGIKSLKEFFKKEVNELKKEFHR